MTSIGETLRQERLRQGLDMQQVSESTKIGTRMLQAMEQNDFTKLPGGVFTRSFIKQYAAALGLGPNVLEAQLGQLRTDSEEPSKPEPRKDVIPERSHYSLSDYNSSRNSGSFFMSLVWVALALVVGGGVYYVMNRPPAAPAEQVKPQTGDSASKTEPVPAQSVAAAPAFPVQITVTAKEKAWVSITVDGDSQYVGNLQLDEKRTVNAQEKIKLISGNAGALEVMLNGKRVESMGPKGQVRIMEFTAAGAHVVPRTPPKRAPLP